jgi:hypothetical protein
MRINIQVNSLISFIKVNPNNAPCCLNFNDIFPPVLREDRFIINQSASDAGLFSLTLFTSVHAPCRMWGNLQHKQDVNYIHIN